MRPKGEQQLTVAIFGCGNIAGGFDRNPASEALPLTHAGAYVRDGRFSIRACVEPNEGRRKQFMAAWAIPKGYATTAEFLDSRERPDVMSICSPTAFHGEAIDAAAMLGPKLVFCEKPVTPSLADSEKAVGLCGKAGIRMAVNYTRRWDPDVELLRERLKSDHWGRLRAVTGIYNKGVLNNGSHMVDVLHMLLGPMALVGTGRPIYDHFEQDPTIPVWLKAPGGVEIQLAAAHADDYALFELQLVFEKAIVTMEDGGMVWRERVARESEVFEGYRTLDAGIRRAGAYPEAMLKAVDNIFRAVVHGDALASTGETALLAHGMCDSIFEWARQGATAGLGPRT